MTASPKPRRLAAATILLAIWASPAAPAGIEPEAQRVLRAMSDHLAGLDAFAVETEVVTDLVLQDGRKIQRLASGSGVFDRARGFRFERQGIAGTLQLVFDGSRLTLHSGELGGWHGVAVEGGTDAALDEVRHAFGVEAAGGADLLYADPHAGLTSEATDGNHLGEVTIGGVRAHHLSYRAAQVDWQLWVAAEGDPLPLRYVITSKWVAGAPQFAVSIRWETDPEISDADLTFTPPEGARELSAADFAVLDIAMQE